MRPMCRSLLQDLASVEERIRSADILPYLDLDGTLVPLVQDPAAVHDFLTWLADHVPA
jgi:hypothetical protein